MRTSPCSKVKRRRRPEAPTVASCRSRATKGLSLAAILLASCGDPNKPQRQAHFYRAEPRSPGFRSLIGKNAPEVKLPDQHGNWETVPLKGRACVILFADAKFLDLLVRWKDALRVRYRRLPVRWVARIASEGKAIKAAMSVPAGVRLHSDVEAEFESGWKVELRGLYVFFVDARGVVRAAARGAWTFEKMEELFGTIDDCAR